MKLQYRELPELNDDMLIADYCKSKSVIRRLHLLKNILLEAGISHVKSHEICKKLLLECLIPAGTKSNVRGGKFNHIIAKELALNLKKLKMKDYALCVEKKHAMFPEIPDWIIQKGRKTLVGFNQISLFGGGHQLNRGYKYIMDDKMHADHKRLNVKMVCIVKEIPINKGGKSHSILMKGIKTQRIFCVGGLNKLIKDYFNVA